MVFLAITFPLPKKGRPDEQHGLTAEPTTGFDAKQQLTV